MHQSSTSQPRTSAWIISITLEFVAILISLLFVVGVVVEDRFLLTQWLSWIPPVVPLLVALLAAAGVLLLRRKRWRFAVAVQLFLACAASVWLVPTGFGFTHPLVESPTQIRILQWNTNYPAGDDPDSMQALAQSPADIVLISNRGAITSPEQVRRWAADDARVFGAGPFAIITSLPVVESRQVASAGVGFDRWFVGLFTVMPPAWNGRPLRIAMVDLPSRPMLSRVAVAESLREGLLRGNLGEVDMVVGDFNAITGSVILSRCFSNFHDAATQGSSGWIATWPRRFPMWQIDHLLLSPSLRCEGAWTIDPKTSKHRMTMAVIIPVQ